MMSATKKISPETERLFTEKAGNYIVCFSASCPLRMHCLRSILTSYVPTDRHITTCVNLRHPQMQQENCPRFVSDQPLRMPYGLSAIYYDMPSRIERSVKNALIRKFSRKRYYEYHNGTRLLTPDAEKTVRDVLLSYGWTQEPTFLGYKEEYLW